MCSLENGLSHAIPDSKRQSVGCLEFYLREEFKNSDKDLEITQLLDTKYSCK
jgi:hypothetical protein